MSQVAPEEVGQELADLVFGIVEQNWMDTHIGKAVDVKGFDEAKRNEAEWELTYLILFAVTSGCGTFAAADPQRTTATLKSFHVNLLAQIAEQAGQAVADAHKLNLAPRYKLYGQTIEGEDTTHPYSTAYAKLGDAAALQILGAPIDDPQAADIFRETVKVIFTEVREAAIKVMSFQQAIQGKA